MSQVSCRNSPSPLSCQHSVQPAQDGPSMYFVLLSLKSYTSSLNFRSTSILMCFVLDDFFRRAVWCEERLHRWHSEPIGKGLWSPWHTSHTHTYTRTYTEKYWGEDYFRIQERHRHIKRLKCSKWTERRKVEGRNTSKHKAAEWRWENDAKRHRQIQRTEKENVA